MKPTVSRRDLRLRLQKIRCLLLDVDGVLTDGKLHFTSTGDEFKTFDIQDGHGIAMALRAGLLVGFVSGRFSQATAKRAADLGVKIVLQSPVNKMEMVQTVQADYGLRADEICFVGDELVDLPVLRRIGWSVAVPNAVPEVKAAVHYVTRRAGGDGAVREVIEMLLKATGQWGKVIAKYLALLLAGLCLIGRVRAETGPTAATGYIEQFEVPQRDAHGNLQWKLAGDRATFRSDGLMDIYNARAEFYASNQVNFVFTTPICVLDRANNHAATDAAVRLERANMILTGLGGEWTGSNTTVFIRHNVQVILKDNPLVATSGATR